EPAAPPVPGASPIPRQGPGSLTTRSLCGRFPSVPSPPCTRRATRRGRDETVSIADFPGSDHGPGYHGRGVLESSSRPGRILQEWISWTLGRPAAASQRHQGEGGAVRLVVAVEGIVEPGAVAFLEPDQEPGESVLVRGSLGLG